MVEVELTTSAESLQVAVDCVQPAPVVELGKRKKKKKEVVKNTPQQQQILDVIKGKSEELEFNREFRRALLDRFSGGLVSAETP